MSTWYTPPDKFPKRLKGLDMGRFPLWAWPVFAETLAPRENEETKRLSFPLWREKVSLSERRKQVNTANRIVAEYSERGDLLKKYALESYEVSGREHRLPDYYDGEAGHIMREGIALGVDANVTQVVLDRQRTVKKYTDGAYRYVVKAVQQDPSYEYLQIVWSSYFQRTHCIQIFDMRKSYKDPHGSSICFLFDIDESDESSDAEDQLLPGQHAEHLGGSPFLPWLDEGRAYIEFDMGTHTYNATIRSLWALNDYVPYETNHIKSATIGDIRKGSPFTRGHLEMVLALHGIEVK